MQAPCHFSRLLWASQILKCQADMVIQPKVAQHGPTRWQDGQSSLPRPGLADPVNRSEGVASRRTNKATMVLQKERAKVMISAI